MHSRRELLKSTVALMAALWRAGPVLTEEKMMIDAKKPNAPPSLLTYNELRAVSPALEHYTKAPLLDGLWKRPELSRRDRSVVTVSALIARIQTIEMPFHFALALDNGVNWYTAAMQQNAGRITAVSMTKDVTFAPIKGSINDQIDDAYRTKYRSSPYLQPMIDVRGRCAMVKIEPRKT